MLGSKGLADSRRFAEKTSASPHFTIPVVWPAVPLPLRRLASITTVYISPLEMTYLSVLMFLELLFLCVCRIRSLVCVTMFLRIIEAHCLVCCDYDTFNLPLVFSCHSCRLTLMPSGLRICSLSPMFFCTVVSPTRFLMAVCCGVTCRQTQRQQHFVMILLYESDAQLRRVFKPTEHESSSANLLRPYRVHGGSTVGEAVC